MSSKVSPSLGFTMSAKMVTPASLAWRKIRVSSFPVNRGLLKMLAKDKTLALSNTDSSTSSGENFHRLPWRLVTKVLSPSSVTSPTLMEVEMSSLTFI